MLTNEQRMQIEMNRTRDLLAGAVEEVESCGGDIRLFGAALLIAAIQLHIQLEGIENLEKAISGIATRELIRSGAVKGC